MHPYPFHKIYGPFPGEWVGGEIELEGETGRKYLMCKRRDPSQGDCVSYKTLLEMGGGDLTPPGDFRGEFLGGNRKI